MKAFAYFLMFIGLLCCLYGGYQLFLHNDPNRLAFTHYTGETKNVLNKKILPKRVRIQALQIDIPVLPGSVNHDRWAMSEQGALYLTSSPIPGEKGNSIVYAHNWASLFGNLTNAKPGQEVMVTFADGSEKTFSIEYTSTVSPDEASILAPSKDNRITLYTCTGWFDTKRFVVVAVLDESASFAKIVH